MTPLAADGRRDGGGGGLTGGRLADAAAAGEAEAAPAISAAPTEGPSGAPILPRRFCSCEGYADGFLKADEPEKGSGPFRAGQKRVDTGLAS